MIDQSQTKKRIISALVFCFVLLLLFLAYDNLFFRLKGTTPSFEEVATSSVSIQYHFSQPIKSVDSVLLDDREVTSDSISINDRTVSVSFDKPLDSDSTYTLSLGGISSEWFGNKINSISNEFTPEYIPYDQLSDAEKKAQVDASNSGQVDDKFIDSNTFPIITENWQIEATVLTDTRSALLTVKFFSEIPDYDNGGAIEQVSNSTADKYREEVLNKIKELGGNPDDYEILYQTNEYLQHKYNDDSHFHEE